MTEKTKGKPTKDAIVRFIKDKNYKFVSSRMLSNDYSTKKKQGRTINENNRGLTHYIGGILAKLKDEGVLTLVNETAPSMKYRVNYDALEKLTSQSSP